MKLTQAISRIRPPRMIEVISRPVKSGCSPGCELMRSRRIGANDMIGLPIFANLAAPIRYLKELVFAACKLSRMLSIDAPGARRRKVVTELEREWVPGRFVGS